MQVPIPGGPKQVSSLGNLELFQRVLDVLLAHEILRHQVAWPEPRGRKKRGELREKKTREEHAYIATPIENTLHKHDAVSVENTLRKL